MLRSGTFMLLMLLISSAVRMQAQDSLKVEPLKEKRFTLLVSVGQTREDLTWSIAGNIEGTSPNIYSELIWTDLQGTPFKFDAKWNFWKSFLLRTRLAHLNITSGKVRDTDYEGDNRTLPVFDVTVKSDIGSITSFTGEAGYRILKGKTFQLNAYAGYTSTRQHLFLVDPDGQFDKRLRSTYDPEWYGAVASLEANIFLSKVISVSPQFSYHQITFRSTANWNLIESFRHPVSFEHRAKGFGIEGAVQVQFHINDEVGFFFDGNYSEWQTGKGTDILYLADGTIQHTQLNGVVRKAVGFGIGMIVNF
jgi:hypothetical protein